MHAEGTEAVFGSLTPAEASRKGLETREARKRVPAESMLVLQERRKRELERIVRHGKTQGAKLEAARLLDRMEEREARATRGRGVGGDDPAAEEDPMLAYERMSPEERRAAYEAMMSGGPEKEGESPIPSPPGE